MEARLLALFMLSLCVPLAFAFGTCGNGVVEKFEQCDDSNAINGDGCSSICQKEGESFQVMVYTANDPPPTPALEDLPLLSSISKDGITWTFSQPARVGRFVNGDYYVVGTVTISQIVPAPANGMHGSMMNIQPNIQKSGFDSRISSGRYDASLRVNPPITLTPGNKLVSSRSASSNLKCVMRGYDTSVSPVASISILTSVDKPQPLDAFRPSYARNSASIYLSRNLKRETLPRLAPVAHTPMLAEFEGYMRRPWVDSVFFNFDAAAEYMASYGRENGYMMSFAGLLLTLNKSQSEKEPLLVYMVQYGIDLYGLVEQGHTGWQAHGGHGTGRKFPILLAGVMLGEDKMKKVHANFGEDMQTIYVNETIPVGTFTKSWHTKPETVVYGGHVGVNGESVKVGWGPYEHLPPSQWKSTIGESYRRCCTSVGWVGEALAARLIPGMMEAWNHQQFFDYVDRWMTQENPADIFRIESEAGYSIDGDFMQGQVWKILSGGGYSAAHKIFVDEMWAEYRSIQQDICGNRICDSTETCTSCQTDCGACSLCGDSRCDSDENCTLCPSDCGQCSLCGNGKCDSGECSTCPGDCSFAQCCPDGQCNHGETPATCPADCKAPRNWKVIYADSQETVAEDGKAENAIDQNPASIWHTHYMFSNPGHPHEIQIDLGKLHVLEGFSYLPRQDSSTNGNIKDYEFYVSQQNSSWAYPVAKGTFTGSTKKTVQFPQAIGKYIRLVALNEVYGNPWTNAAEIDVLTGYHTSDIDKNGCISQAELLQYIQDWKEVKATIKSLITAIILWKQECK